MRESYQIRVTILEARALRTWAAVAAAAMAGMVKHGQTALEAPEHSTAVAITMLGNTTTASMAMREVQQQLEHRRTNELMPLPPPLSHRQPALSLSHLNPLLSRHSCRTSSH